MRAYNAHQFVPLKWSGRNWARRMGWSREELDAGARRASTTRIFTRYARARTASTAGATRRRCTPGTSTPWRGCSRTRCSSGSSATPAASVGSNMSRFGHSFNRATRHVGKYDREIARQAARYGDRFALVRYEELVLRPEPVLRELLDWLGEPWSDSVLDAPAACRSTAAASSRWRARTGSTTRSTSRGSTSGTASMPAEQPAGAEEAPRAAGRVLRLLDGRPGGAGAARARTAGWSSAAPTSTHGSTRSQTSTCAPRPSRRSPSASTTRARCSSPRWSSPRQSRPPLRPPPCAGHGGGCRCGVRRRVRRLAGRV